MTHTLPTLFIPGYQNRQMTHTCHGHPGGASGEEPIRQRKTRETWVRSLGPEDPLEEGMTTHSGILAWEIPRTEEFMGSQRVRHN